MNQVNFPLSNVQMELMKLYATDLSNTDLLELKQQLAKFYAEKSIKAADKVWDEKGYTAEDMDRLLKELS